MWRCPHLISSYVPEMDVSVLAHKWPLFERNGYDASRVSETCGFRELVALARLIAFGPAVDLEMPSFLLAILSEGGFFDTNLGSSSDIVAIHRISALLTGISYRSSRQSVLTRQPSNQGSTP